MAADWIKMRVDLYRDPKVCVIADELMAHEGALARYVSQNCQRSMTVTRNVTRNATVGALVTVWGVMRHRGKRDGNDLVCRNVRLCVIDDVCDLPGFGEAMAEGGWVIESAEGIVFPGFFDEYNVDPNERKASAAAERQRRYRERKARERDENRYVTSDVTVTHREEKRREEEKKEQDAPDGAPPGPPKSKGKGGTTLKTFLAECEANDVDAIRADDPVLAYADKIGLPRDYVRLAWRWFKGRFGEGGPKEAQRQRDWPAHFRNAVKGGWPGYWAVDRQGVFYLTAAGKQAELEAAS